MNQMKQRVLALLALTLVSGCNTIVGLGRDLQAGGEAISELSREVRGSADAGEPVETASND